MIDPRRIEMIDDKDADVLRAMTPERRVEMVGELCRFAWGVAEAAIRERYPQWSDEQVKRELARRVAIGSD